jgi:translocator protein
MPINYKQLIPCLLLPQLVGFTGAYATISSIKTWYITLNKPWFNPPNYLFGPVWNILYLLMGVSFYLVLQNNTATNSKAKWIFGIQLFLNFCWSFLFFKFQMLGIAMIEIHVMWLSILAMIIVFYNINKTAALLQIPYLLWVSFATVLNTTLWYIN